MHGHGLRENSSTAISRSREEDSMSTNVCPRGKPRAQHKTYWDSHIKRMWEIFLKKRDALEDGMRKCDVRGMKVECDTLYGSVKVIAMVGAKWWPQTVKHKGDKTRKQFLCRIRNMRIERPKVGRVPIKSTNGVLSLERDAWSMVNLPMQATNEYAPLTRCALVN